ncbi:hypothetical protein Baya_11723 [Bagarius yarrelli]|uniref:Uncharacterized protein n=1 Tax=Bagarius yarrelli TaxID=175774 RepID=A0A556V1C5_BAGYA|nr:hypothetical protein Baya_11723 [Bagarius yarrelli]
MPAFNCSLQNELITEYVRFDLVTLAGESLLFSVCVQYGEARGAARRVIPQLIVLKRKG